VARDSHHCGVRRDVGHYHGAGADAGIVAHIDSADDLGAGADHYVAAQSRVALDALATGPSQGYPLVEGAVIADLGRLADDHAGPVVDEEAIADAGSGMDLDAGDGAAQVGDDPRREVEAPVPEGVGQAVSLAGVEAWIGQDDLQGAAGRRVPLQCRLNIPSHATEEAHTLLTPLHGSLLPPLRRAPQPSPLTPPGAEPLLCRRCPRPGPGPPGLRGSSP